MSINLNPKSVPLLLTIYIGQAFYGYAKKAIESLGESKSPLEIASLLASRLGIRSFDEVTEEGWLKGKSRNTEIPNFDEFLKRGVYRIGLAEPYVALRKQIEDPVNHPFPTPSGKIEIYSQQLADLDRPQLPAIPKNLETCLLLNVTHLLGSYSYHSSYANISG